MPMQLLGVQCYSIVLHGSLKSVCQLFRMIGVQSTYVLYKFVDACGLNWCCIVVITDVELVLHCCVDLYWSLGMVTCVLSSCVAVCFSVCAALCLVKLC